MAQEQNAPVKKDGGALISPDMWDWRPFEALRRQLDRFFDEAPLQKRTGDMEPFGFMGWQGTPPSISSNATTNMKSRRSFQASTRRTWK
ncbi:hypothetical protein WOA01_12800 [Methylocystis sp. IM2]|uniref:hypothetical protein n=1 Tax=unclassified Methylocystis TaxID=2625913 RepID=UPI0030F98215